MESQFNRRGFLGLAAGAGAGLAAGGLKFGIGKANAQEVFQLGWVRPTTGRLASSFAPLFVGGLIAIDEINAAGGILGRQIVRVEEDDEGSPAKQPGIIRKLSDAGISYLCGPAGSSQTLASLEASTAAQIIQTGSALAAALADGAKYPYHYQLTYNTNLQAELIASHAAKVLKGQKIGILHEATAFGEQGATATIAELQKLGLNPSTVQSFPADVASFDPYITNLQNAGTDVLVAWLANISSVAMAFRSMNSLGWSPPIVGHNGLFADGLFDLVPVELLQNVVCTYYKAMTYTATESPGARQVEYANKIAQYPEAKAWAVNVVVQSHYDFLHLLKKTIEQEQTFDVAKIKAALDQTKDFDGIVGKINFTPENHCGISIDDMVLAKLASGRDPKAQGIFRERI
jgi:ABC-type branched-subunit amino acid transport system substrate-binding protein